MATTPRGYPIITGKMPPAGPSQMQQLAEAIDADLSAAVGRWVKVGPPIVTGTVTGISPTAYVFPNLQLSVPVVAGRTYRVGFQVDTNSSAVVDIISIKLRADGVQFNECAHPANSSPTTSLTTIQHLVTGFFTATTTTTALFTVSIQRVAGTGSVTAAGPTSFLSVERY